MRLKKLINTVFESEFKVILILYSFYVIGFVFALISNSALNFGQTLRFDSFTQLLFKNSIFLFSVFLSGYTAFGIPLICFSLIYLGMSNSLLITYYTINYGLKGILFCNLIFSVYFSIVLISFLYTSFSSLRLTLIMFNSFKPKSRFISPAAYSLPHFIRFVFFAIFTAIITFLYSYILVPFLNLFL